MTRSHILRTREFLGQFEADQLVLWLQTNEFPKGKRRVTEKDRTPEFRRMSRLLALLKEAQKLRGQEAKPNKAEQIARTPLLREANQLLRRYSYGLRMGDLLETRLVEVKPPAVFPSEERAAMHMVRLSELGLLERVRPCAWCTSWFFARFRHQNYCKRQCQQKAYAVSPKWQKHRREYMQNYRRVISRKRISGKNFK
jgi:hypothetical protein